MESIGKKSAEIIVQGAHSSTEQHSVKSCLVFISCCDLQWNSHRRHMMSSKPTSSSLREVI